MSARPTLILGSVLVVAGLLGGCASDSAVDSSAASETASASTAESASASSTSAAGSAPASTASIDLSAHSITDPTSIWVVVNKHRPMTPLDWAPSDLTTVTLSGTSAQMRTDAAAALQKLATASDAATGKTMTIDSGYRSYTTQVSVYNGWKDQDGQAEADLLSARAGYSEHQTGLAADIDEAQTSCGLNECFGTTSTGTWVAANAWQYGFIVRYAQGATAQTGYDYEPWHLRYVGVDLATYMHQNGITTLETVFGLENATDYE